MTESTKTIAPEKLEEFMAGARQSYKAHSLGYGDALRLLETLHSKGMLGDFLLDMAAAQRMSTGDPAADMERLKTLLTPERRAMLDKITPWHYPKLGAGLDDPQARLRPKGRMLDAIGDIRTLGGMAITTAALSMWVSFAGLHTAKLAKHTIEHKKDKPELVARGDVATIKKQEGQITNDKWALGVTAAAPPLILLLDYLVGKRKTDDEYNEHMHYFLEGLDDMLNQLKTTGIAPEGRGTQR